jgi:photosystem II stability/assembly factor-like uncharacterized protein
MKYIVFFIACLAAALFGFRAVKIASPVQVRGESAVRDDNNSNVKLLPLARRGFHGELEIHDVSCLGGNIVWAAGSKLGDSKPLIFSRDGGRTWESRSVGPNEMSFNRIAFSDAQNGWAVGDHGLIVRTTDGGNSWQMMRSPTNADLDSVKFIDANTGYVAGGDAFVPMNDEARRASHGLDILRTTDGGLNWSLVYHKRDSHNAFGIEALSERVIFVSDGMSILRTVDGGASWQNTPSPGKFPRGLRIAPDGTLWAVGRDGAFLRSFDQGQSWQVPTTVPSDINEQMWWDIDFADSLRGVAVGDEGACVVTDDGGNTWKDCGIDLKDPVSGFSDHLRKIRFSGDTGMVLGAEKLYEIALN